MNHFRPISASIGALARSRSISHEPPRPLPFVTVTRQAGCGGIELMHLLLQRLRQRDPGEPLWTGWHKELVERVARDHQLHQSLVETLCDRDHSLLSDLLISLDGDIDYEESELAIHHRIAETTRALAQQGKVILVGRGSVFITRDMPAGLHIYLVAPRDCRIAAYARSHQLSQNEAAREIDRIDHNRAVFYRRHFRNMPLTPELFDLTINTDTVSDAHMVEMILPLVPPATAPRVTAAPTVAPATAPRTQTPQAPPIAPEPVIIRKQPTGSKDSARLNASN